MDPRPDPTSVLPGSVHAPAGTVEATLSAAADEVRDAVHHTVHGGGDAPGRWVEVLGRVGLIAYGGLHVMIAVLVVRTVLGARTYVAMDQNGAVAVVAGLGDSGRILLALSVAGLLAFGAWQSCAAVAGFRWVDGGERFRKRVGAGAKAIAVLALALVAAPVVLGERPESGGGGTRLLTAGLLALPGGQVLVTALGVTAVLVAASMLYTGARATFMGDLQRDRLPPLLRRVAITLGSAGNFARAAAFSGVGLSFTAAGVTGDPARSGGVNQVLRTLSTTGPGLVALVLIAAGIGGFGLYCGIDAYARRA